MAKNGLGDKKDKPYAVTDHSQHDKHRIHTGEDHFQRNLHMPYQGKLAQEALKLRRALTAPNISTFNDIWRLGPESNRLPRLCRPLHDHSATQP